MSTGTEESFASTAFNSGDSVPYCFSNEREFLVIDRRCEVPSSSIPSFQRVEKVSVITRDCFSISANR